MKKLLTIVLSMIICFSFSISVFAENKLVIEKLPSNSRSITLYFNNSNSPESFSTNNVTAFFEENQLNYDYYMNWLNNQDTTNLDSVTFTVVGETYTPITHSSSSIQGSRIVYADKNYHHTERKYLEYDNLVGN